MKFHEGSVKLWLPQSAEVYFACRGRQVRGRHSFSNYLLFGGDERQRIATPKEAQAPAEAGPGRRQSPRKREGDFAMRMT